MRSGGLNFTDLTGRFFNDWEVLKRGKDYISPKGKHYVQWLCKCKCGKEALVRPNKLIGGHSKSCGYCNDLIMGNRYGKWVEPVEYVQNYVSPSGRQMRQVKCICHYKGENCKGYFIARIEHVKSNWIKSCGCLQRTELIERNTKLEGTHITPLITQYYNCTKYRTMQNECFDRNDNCCIILGKLSRKLLNIHHIVPRWFLFKKYNVTTEEQMYACKELWDINNLVTISEEWHMGIKTNNPLALHKIYNGRIYTEENYYSWLKEMEKNIG